MNINKKKVLVTLNDTFSNFIEGMEKLETIDLESFNKETTLIVILDMINGFTKVGALHSPYVNALVPKMKEFVDQCVDMNIPIIAYRDAHTTCSPEFNAFPEHCLKGSEESELIDELKHDAIIQIEKNSTNGFLARNPLNEIQQGDKIKDVIVIGCVTDICVRDFAKTINKYFEQINHIADVYVVENLVDTFQIDNIHDRELEHVLALYDMLNSGIKIVRW